MRTLESSHSRPSESGPSPGRASRPREVSRLAHALHGASNGVMIGAAVGVVLGLAALAGVDRQRATSEHPSYAQRLADLHDCWSGPAPADMAGEVPGGTVMKPAGSQVPVYRHSPHAV